MRVEAQAGGGGDELAGALASEATAEGLGGGDDQGVQLALGVGGGAGGGASCGEADGQRRPCAFGPWLGETRPGQCFSGGPDGVEGVGLGAVAASGSFGPVQLR